jgi:hypothetical protein
MRSFKGNLFLLNDRILLNTHKEYPKIIGSVMMDRGHFRMDFNNDSFVLNNTLFFRFSRRVLLENCHDL